MDTPREALSTILPVAGWPDDRAVSVAFTGGSDPVLPTPFRIGVAGAATVAAAGLAADELWRVRGGRPQNVAVDLRQATAALRSGTYMKLGDGELSTARHGFMGVYPSKDGRWSYLHCNFPNHRAAALSVLGVREDQDREALARAVKTWTAAELEEAIVAAKGAGGKVRTKAEWAKHPQCAAIAQLPPSAGRAPRRRTITASISAPEASRIEVKLAASIVVSRSAMRHSSELLAKASIASVVRMAMRVRC